MNFTDNQLLEWLRFCSTIQSLKELTRQGSAAAGFNRGDSDTVAGHTASVGIISLLLAWQLKIKDDLTINPAFVASVALVHDLNSSILGDVNSEVKQLYFGDYQLRERLAFQDLVQGLQCANELLALYDKYKTENNTIANIVRFTNGLDGWLEVIPRAALAWMEQHKDYRDRTRNMLMKDMKYGDSLAEMYDKVCDVLYDNKISPKRPAAISKYVLDKKVLVKLDNLPLPNEQLVEWLQVCQTVQRLKRLTRQGFITSGGFNRWDTDSIADHIAIVTIISFVLALELIETEHAQIDPFRVTALGLIHDLGESILGDVSSEGKKRYYQNYASSEKAAINDLVGNLLCGPQLLQLFDEFEMCKTTEAKIVRFADSLDAWMRVVPRSRETWMPQHIEYRNRTFEKLKGDGIFGDSLSELFLRACLAVQGQLVGPKRPPKDDAMTRNSISELSSDIVGSIGKLQKKKQNLTSMIEHSQGHERERYINQRGDVQADISKAMEELLVLQANLAEKVKQEDQ
jgi:5'-deoxynucleotidase YfbR-like HD superfamily hydrolase